MSDATMLLERLADEDALRAEFTCKTQDVLDRFVLSEEERRAFMSLDLDDVDGLGTQGFRPIECRVLRVTW